MPFTLAHPAIVLPLRRHLPLSALVAGTVAPDLPYYVPGLAGRGHTHSLAGVVGVDLAAGLALMALAWLAAAPALAFAPAAVRSRVPGVGPFRPLVSVVAVVLGAATHVVWDWFTQVNGLAVRHWPWLRVAVVEPHKLYNVIGYACSVGGIAVLAWCLWRWYRRTPSGAGAWAGLPGRLRIAVLGALAASTVIGAVAGATSPAAKASGYDFVRHTLIGSCRGLVLGFAVYAALWFVARLVRSRQTA